MCTCFFLYVKFPDNEIDGETLLQLSEQMIARLLPTIRLQVKLINVLADLKRDSLDLSAASISATFVSTAVIPSSDR